MIRLQKEPFSLGINRDSVDDPVSDQIAFAASCSTANLDVPKNRDGFNPSRVDASPVVVMVRLAQLYATDLGVDTLPR